MEPTANAQVRFTRLALDELAEILVDCVLREGMQTDGVGKQLKRVQRAAKAAPLKPAGRAESADAGASASS